MTNDERKALMPEEPTPEILHAMHLGYNHTHGSGYERMAGVYRALYAHLTAPKTKEVEVWRIEYVWKPRGVGPWEPTVAQYATEEMARSHGHGLGLGDNAACIRVTGPHKQMVPA